MNDVVLSIIIPVYNVENYIRRCLDSIFNQKSSIRFEVLLINDGSTDSSGEICDEYQLKYSNVFVTHTENRGVSKARNLGMSLSRGDMLYFVDPDDYLSNEFFSKVSQYVLKDWEVLCFGYYEVKERRGEILSCRNHRYLQIGETKKEEFVNRFVELFRTDMMYNVWSRIYRRDFVMRNGIDFPDRKIGEDTFFNFQVYKHVKQVDFIDSELYYYVSRRSGSALTSFNPDRVKLQLEELEELEELLGQFGLSDEKLLLEIKVKIVVSSAFQIANSEAMNEPKIELLSRLVQNHQFNEVFFENKSHLIGTYWELLVQRNLSLLLRRITIDLLSRKRYRCVLFVEKMKMNPLLRKIAFK